MGKPRLVTARRKRCRCHAEPMPGELPCPHWIPAGVAVQTQFCRRCARRRRILDKKRWNAKTSRGRYKP